MNLIPSPSSPTLVVVNLGSNVNETTTARPVRESPEPEINDGFVDNTFLLLSAIPDSIPITESVNPMVSLTSLRVPINASVLDAESVNEIDSDKQIPSHVKWLTFSFSLGSHVPVFSVLYEVLIQSADSTLFATLNSSIIPSKG